MEMLIVFQLIENKSSLNYRRHFSGMSFGEHRRLLIYLLGHDIIHIICRRDIVIAQNIDDIESSIQEL